MEIYLYRLIDEQGTSISAIAREMGVSIQYISNVARGQRVSIKILERIASVLGVPAWRLLCPPEDDHITQGRMKQHPDTPAATIGDGSAVGTATEG